MYHCILCQIIVISSRLFFSSTTGQLTSEGDCFLAIGWYIGYCQPWRHYFQGLPQVCCVLASQWSTRWHIICQSLSQLLTCFDSKWLCLLFTVLAGRATGGEEIPAFLLPTIASVGLCGAFTPLSQQLQQRGCEEDGCWCFIHDLMSFFIICIQ